MAAIFVELEKKKKKNNIKNLNSQKEKRLQELLLLVFLQ